MDDETGLIRATTLSGFESMTQRLGQDPERLIAMAGLDPILLREPDLYMPFSRFMLLMELAAKETGNKLFGAELGMDQGLRVLGTMAYGMSTSLTLSEALEFILKNLTLQSTGNIIWLERFNEQCAMLCCEIIVASPHGAQQTLNHTVALGMRMMRSFYGDSWSPMEVFFQHGASEIEKAQYRRLFGKSLQFDAETSGFTFDPKLLDLPLPDADPVAHKMFEQQMEQQLSGSRRDFKLRIQSLIRMGMPNGDVSIEHTARMLSISPRSLQRKLQDRDTSFQELLDITRRKLAEHYLLNSELQLSQISELLGFSRASNLTHAFRRWHDVSPSEWRKIRARDLA